MFVFQNLRAVYRAENANNTALYEQMYDDVFGSEEEESSSADESE